MKEISDYFGLHYSKVSRIIKKQEEQVVWAKGKTCPSTFALLFM
ncbi:MAG: hypothetical protein ABW166_18130 [Sedimenticola sp.]